ALVTGLLDDRGNFTPGLTSPGAWPTTGGSGTAGALMKGDIWFCSASGFMGTTAVVAGSSFRAIVDSPGQTDSNWNVLSAGAISTSTPSLQQVTAVGASTTRSMSIGNGNAAIDFQVFSSSNGGVQLAVDPFNKGYAYIASGNGTGAFIKANNITTDRDIQLPNASGTLALTTDVGLPYLVYSALLSFDGSTVTTTVLQNTLGESVTWTNPSNGMFRGSCLGTPFTVGKTWISSGGFNNSGSPMIVTSQPRGAFPAKEIEYRFFLHDGTISSTPLITNYSIEIRVYP
ncbi:MAG: hypothetical protein ACK5XN_12275, partial [Bacteroidota bacterium]